MAHCREKSLLDGIVCGSGTDLPGGYSPHCLSVASEQLLEGTPISALPESVEPGSVLRSGAGCRWLTILVSRASSVTEVRKRHGIDHDTREMPSQRLV